MPQSTFFCNNFYILYFDRIFRIESSKSVPKKDDLLNNNVIVYTRKRNETKRNETSKSHDLTIQSTVSKNISVSTFR